MGIIKVTPRLNEIRISRSNHVPLSVRAKRRISIARTIASPILILWRCGSRIGLPLIRSESFRNATIEPVKVIAPIAAPKDISNRLPGSICPGAPMPKACGAKKRLLRLIRRLDLRGNERRRPILASWSFQCCVRDMRQRRHLCRRLR